MVKTRKPINVSDGRGDDIIAKGTARIDTAKSILQNGWTNAVVRDHRLTDDYKRDMANDFGSNKDVSAENLLDTIENGADPKRIWIEKRVNGRQILIFYWSFMEYRAEIDTRKIKFDFEAKGY